MIAGHVQLGIPRVDDWFSIWCYAWHMPIFFLISGLLYKEKENCIFESSSYFAPFLLLEYYKFYFGRAIGLWKKCFF